MKIKLFLVSCFTIHFLTIAQQRTLSPEAEISVLTIGPGTSLNDAFGHNAFRINDNTFEIDLVFNYGVYDFDTPNFYTKFAQGKLEYKIGLNYYEDFFNSYVSHNRTIEEQILNLSQQEKQQLFDYLIINYKPENRNYIYDFFFDNCATKIRDVLENVLENDVIFNSPKNLESKTFRSLIHDHVDRNSWGGFGIDIALGSVIDKDASPYEHMYLPKYIFSFFDTATRKNSDKLVEQTKVIYKKKEEKTSINWLLSPLGLFSIIGALIIAITFFDHKKKRRTKWLDIVLFAFTGLIGVLIVLLWFATDHSATAQNYNLLWGFPLNLILIVQLFKNQVKNWFRRYLKFLVIILGLLALHWIIGIQVYAIGLIPLLLALIIRYVYLIKFYNSSEVLN